MPDKDTKPVGASISSDDVIRQHFHQQHLAHIAHQTEIGSHNLAAFIPAMIAAAQPSKTAAIIAAQTANVSLSLSGIITPGEKLAAGTLVACTSHVWNDIVTALGADWSIALKIPPEKWEEIVAGGFSKAGFNVILTPRSGDHGRDVIATKDGFLSIKILGSVKAYSPGHLVEYDHVRALLGVLSGERDASKGIVMTTSDFPPKINEDPFISPFLPTRLELLNGEQLRQWLLELAGKGRPPHSRS
jgi:restriction system protein